MSEFEGSDESNAGPAFVVPQSAAKPSQLGTARASMDDNMWRDMAVEHSKSSPNVRKASECPGFDRPLKRARCKQEIADSDISDSEAQRRARPVQQNLRQQHSQTQREQDYERRVRQTSTPSPERPQRQRLGRSAADRFSERSQARSRPTARRTPQDVASSSAYVNCTICLKPMLLHHKLYRGRLHQHEWCAGDRRPEREFFADPSKAEARPLHHLCELLPY